MEEEEEGFGLLGVLGNSISSQVSTSSTFLLLLLFGLLLLLTLLLLDLEGVGVFLLWEALDPDLLDLLLFDLEDEEEEGVESLLSKSNSSQDSTSSSLYLFFLSPDPLDFVFLLLPLLLLLDSFFVGLLAPLDAGFNSNLPPALDFESERPDAFEFLLLILLFGLDSFSIDASSLLANPATLPESPFDNVLNSVLKQNRLRCVI